MTRSLFALAFILAAQVGTPEPWPRRLAPDTPLPQLMTNLMAVLDAAREFGIDPNFAFSVTWHESRFNERAIARRWREVDGETVLVVTARGLMQHSPKYQTEHVIKYLPGMNPVNFRWSNPVHSARLGCAMLADYVARFGYWGALAVYNAGIGRYKELWTGRPLPQETVRYQREVLG